MTDRKLLSGYELARVGSQRRKTIFKRFLDQWSASVSVRVPAFGTSQIVVTIGQRSPITELGSEKEYAQLLESVYQIAGAVTYFNEGDPYRVKVNVGDSWPKNYSPYLVIKRPDGGQLATSVQRAPVDEQIAVNQHNQVQLGKLKSFLTPPDSESKPVEPDAVGFRGLLGLPPAIRRSGPAQ